MFNYGNPWLVITVFSLCLHEIFYFGRYIPYMIYDQIPSLQKYKLQEDKVVTSEERWHCTRQVLFVHFFYAGAYIVFFYPVAKTLGLDFFKIPFPDWKELFVHLAVCFIVEDSWHYWLHRAMHYGPFYKYIHKVHHEYSAPFGIAAEYAHPIEVALLGLGSFLGPMLILGVSGNMHAITAEAFVALRICQAVEAHSGYDLPWSLHNIIPFWAGAEHHDFHHQAFVDCYASSFRWNDSIFGTDSKYHSARERMRQKKLKMSQNKDKTQ
ncbi:sterol desaturase [Neoconidiobolus thromboides FSU 785]|nr:sterol desaturase [Neoconidiobolus thromboides FSU 785]